MWACMVVNPQQDLKLVFFPKDSTPPALRQYLLLPDTTLSLSWDTKVFHLQRNLLHDPLQLLALYTAYGCHNYCTIIQTRLIKLQQMPLLCNVGQDLPKYTCVIQPLLVTHSMDLLSQHGRSPHGHLIPTGSQQHRDALEDGVYSRYSALTGQEDTHTIQEQRQHHQSLSQLIIYKASFGIDLEQHLAVHLLGNDKEAIKYQVQQQDGLGQSHPHHQQGDGRVHHAHLLQHCSLEPAPEHHASRPILSIRISVLRLQKLNNMQTALPAHILRYEPGGGAQPPSRVQDQCILCQGLLQAVQGDRGLVQYDALHPTGTGHHPSSYMHGEYFVHRFLHRQLQISTTQASSILLLKLRLMQNNPEDGFHNKLVKVNNNVLRGFHDSNKSIYTTAVMFSVSKATDEISCFSLCLVQCLPGAYAVSPSRAKTILESLWFHLILGTLNY
jgi:hypothetical protein